MASSGYLGTSNQYVKYWIEVITNSQNVANNTSNVTVKVWAKRTNTGYTTWGSGSVTLKVNGSYHNSGNKQIEITSTSKVYHSWTGNITHNADGTKNLSCSAAINIPTILSSSEQGYSEDLKTIPRTSTFTLSKSSCELGTSLTINISRASSSFTHTVIYERTDKQRYVIQNKGSSVSATFTPALSDAELIPNSTSGTAKIIVETYSGNTKIGMTSKDFTVTIPSNFKPTFSGITAGKIYDANVPFESLVQGYSKIQVIIHEAKGIYGSYISKHYATINGVDYVGNTNVYKSGVITNSGDIQISADVMDSRGIRAGIKNTHIKVEPYSKPYITNVKIERVDENLEYNSEGVYVNVNIKKHYSSVNNENTCIVAAFWRVVGGNWSEEYIVEDETNFNFNKLIFSPDKAYDIRIRIKDKLNTIDTYYNIPTAEVTLDFKKGGKGIAIGKVSETDNLLDVNFNALFRKELRAENGILNKQCFSDGKGYYHYSQGCLVTTNIHSNTNSMVELYITGNSYMGKIPIHSIVNCYVYNNDIIERSGYCSGLNIPVKVFFNNEGYLCFWIKQTSNYITLRFELCVSTGVANPYYIVNDTQKPNDTRNEYDIYMYKSFNEKNSFAITERGYSNINGYFMRFSDGTQICWKEASYTCDITKAEGSMYVSTNTVQFGAWERQFVTGVAPMVFVMPNNSFAHTVGNVFSMSSTSAGGSWIYKPTAAAKATGKSVIFAIGRWKQPLNG